MSIVQRWLTISLVANVFLLGVLGGGVYKWTTTPHRVQQRGLRFAASELSESRQVELKMAIQQMRKDPERQHLVRAAREGRTEVISALSASPFDLASLNAALSSTLNADVALRSQTESVIANFAAGLDHDERLRLLDGMSRHGSLQVPRAKRTPQN